MRSNMLSVALTLFLVLLLHVDLSHAQGAAAVPAPVDPVAAAVKAPAKAAAAVKEAVEAARPVQLPPTGDDEKVETTFFNGQEVPAIIDLVGTTFKEDISKGYWLVEAFSPYCSHCKSLAPKWQTIYEFYYTSDPLPASTEPVDSKASLNSFSRYYDTKFAKLNCVAWGTACSQDAGVHSFPTIILYKDGQEIKKSSGDKSMKGLSAFVEECLEIIRPGSRPQGGVKLPKVGDKSFVTTPDVVKGSSKDTNAKSSFQETGPHVRPALARLPVIPPHYPNSNGTSISFTAKTFDEQVTKTLNGWLIKFYAPWCPHCQRMAPSWSQMAREMEGKLDIGEVNCDVEKRLCREFGVNSYPVIMFLKGPERADYEGLRGLGDFIDFGNKAIAASSGVKDVDARDFEEMEKTDSVIFVYFYDHATTIEDFMALDRIPINLIGHAKIVKTKDPKLVKRYKITTWPRLIVSRDGKYSVYDQIAPQEYRRLGKVMDWIRSVWLPLVPELTASNARDIMDAKYVVLGVLSRDRPEEMAIARRELKNAAIEWIDREELAYRLERQELRVAKQLRIDEAEDRKNQAALRNAKQIRIDMNEIQRKEVTFAWVDGVFWERWVKTTFGISVKDGEKVVVNDEENRRYWDSTITGNPIVPSRTSILETLPKIVHSPPKLSPKPTGSTIGHYIFRLRSTMTSHPWAAAILILGMVGASVVFLGRWRKRRRDYGSTGSFFQLNGHQHGPILGTSSPNGKAD